MKTEVDNFTPFDLIFDHNINIIAEQRIIIYSTSLEIYKQRKAKGCLAGICTCIKRTLDRLELYNHFIEQSKIDVVARKLLMESGLSNKDFLVP